MAERARSKCNSQQRGNRAVEGFKVHDLTIDSDEEKETSASKIKTSARNLSTSQGPSIEISRTSSTEETDNTEKKTILPVRKSVRSRLSKSKKSKKNIEELENLLKGGPSLDETSDFSGGFTPYKALAQKKYQHAQGTSRSLSRSDSSQSPSKGTRRGLRVRKIQETQSKESCDQKREPEEKPRIEDEGGESKKESDDNSCAFDIPTEGEEEKGDQSGICTIPSSEQTAPGNDGDKSKKCGSCGEMISPREIQDHLKICLRRRFGRKKDETSASIGPTSAGQASEPVPFIFCQVCQTDLSAETAEDRERHVNLCIDQGPSLHGEGDKGFKCDICKRDLMHLNASRRQQHFNHCAGKLEKERQKEEDEKRAMDEARNKVLDCPLCGKHLKTQASRQSHVKACAKMYGVSAAVLRDRLEQQKEEYMIQLAAGILPTDSGPPRATVKRKKPGPSTSRTTRFTDPKSRLDEDTQLALALSNSLRDHGHGSVPGTTTALTEEQLDGETVGQGKDYFSILMTPKKSANMKRRKKKGGPARVPALLLRTPEELQAHLAAKVAAIIGQVEPESDPPLPLRESRLLLEEDANKENLDLWEVMKDAPWWNLSKQLSKTLTDEDGEIDLGAFYVKSIMPPVTYRPKMRKKSVDDQRPSPSLRKTMERKSSSNNSTTTVHNDTLIASTQTAVFLAELAAESGNKTVNFSLRDGILDTTNLGSSGGSGTTRTTPVMSDNSFRGRHGMIVERVHDKDAEKRESEGEVRYEMQSDRNRGESEGKAILETSGFLPSGEENASIPQGTLDLVHQLTSMVDNPICSDLKVNAADGHTVSAHKFMLAARCPTVLEELRGGSILDLSAFNKSTVLVVLEYIYSGSIEPLNISWPVSVLARRFHLTDLEKKSLDYLEQRRSTGQENTEETNQTQVKDLLEKIWGSDYEESDSDLDEKPKDEDQESLEDQQELEDACDYVLTQRRRQSQREEESSSETEDMNISDENRSNAKDYPTESDGEEDEMDGASMGISKNDYLNMTHMDVISKLVDMDTHREEAEIGTHIQTTHLQEPYECNDEDLGDKSFQADKPNLGETKGDSPPNIIPDNNIHMTSDNDSDKSESGLVIDLEEDDKRSSGNLSSSDDEAAICNENLATPGLFNGLSDEKVNSKRTRKTVRRFATRTQELNSTISGMKMLDVDGDDEDEEEEKDDAGSEGEQDLSIDLFDHDAEEEVIEDPIQISDGSISPPGSPHPSNINPLQDEESTKHSNASSVNDHRPDSANCSNVSILGDCISIPGSPDQNHASPFPEGNHIEESDNRSDRSPAPGNFSLAESPNCSNVSICGDSVSLPESLGQPQDNFSSPFSPDHISSSPDKRKTHREDVSHNSDSDNSGAPCIISSRSNSPIFHSHIRKKSPDKQTRNVRGFTQPFSDTELEEERVLSSQGNWSSLNRSKRKRGDSDSDQDMSPSNGNLLGSQAKRSRLSSDCDKQASSQESRIKRLSPNVTRRSSQLNQAAVSPRSSPHREAEYVISSDSEIDQAPIDLTQEEEGLSDRGILEEKVVAGEDDDRRSEGSLPSPVQLPPDEDHMADNDVWSDFDDVGFNEDFNMPPSQEKGLSPSGPADERPSTTPKILDYDPPTDIESDVSFLADKEKSPVSHGASRFETPRVPVVQRKKSVRSKVPASPFTPMADFKAMPTPDLKKKCANYGVKVVPKKKMIKLLEHLYHETHQYETDSELEQSIVDQSPVNSSAQNPGPSNTIPPRSLSAALTSSQEKGRGAAPKKGRKRATAQVTLTQLHGSGVQGREGSDNPDDPVNEKEEEGAEDIGNMSPGEELLEESIMGSQTDSPVKAGGKKPKDKATQIKVKREKIREYIQSNQDLYLRILQYEPLEFDEFKQTLKDAGINVGTDVLMDFLDEQNIQFTMRKRSEEKGKRRNSPARSQCLSPGKRRGRGRGRGRGAGSRDRTAKS